MTVEETFWWDIDSTAVEYDRFAYKTISDEEAESWEHRHAFRATRKEMQSMVDSLIQLFRESRTE